MSYFEACRQYQIALELDHKLQNELAGTMSADSKRKESKETLERMKAGLFNEWLTQDPA